MKKTIDALLGVMSAGLILLMFDNVSWVYEHPQPYRTLGYVLNFAFGMVTFGIMIPATASARNDSDHQTAKAGIAAVSAFVCWLAWGMAYEKECIRFGWWFLGLLVGGVLAKCSLASERWQRGAVSVVLPLSVSAILYGLRNVRPLPHGYMMGSPLILIVLSVIAALFIWIPPKRLYAFVARKLITPAGASISRLRMSQEERRRQDLREERACHQVRIQVIDKELEPGRFAGGPLRVAPVLDDDLEASGEIASAEEKRVRES